MDTDTDQTSENAPSSAQEVVSSSVTNASVTPASSTKPDSSEPAKEASTEAEESTEGDVKEAPETPVYVPNYKLKVYDQEKDLEDPFLKALIKDADSEKKVKEIAQKYLGFDVVKEKNQKMTQDFQGYQQATQPIVQTYNQYQKLAQAGDLEGILSFLKIPDQEIFKYALQKAEESQLPAEQRAYLQQQRQIQQRAMTLEEQNQQLQSSQNEKLGEFRNQEMNWVLSRPDVHPVAQSYDAKNGPNAFRQFVRKIGLAHFAETGGDISAEQATQEAMKMIGGFVTPTTQTMPQPPQLIQQNGAPPIIPNVTGRGTSPVKKQVRSIADLKKRHEELGRSS